MNIVGLRFKWYSLCHSQTSCTSSRQHTMSYYSHIRVCIVSSDIAFLRICFISRCRIEKFSITTATMSLCISQHYFEIFHISPLRPFLDLFRTHYKQYYHSLFSFFFVYLSTLITIYVHRNN